MGAKKRERLYYLDFIRAISTIVIVLTHFNAIYLYNVSPARPECAVITLWVSNIYIGGFGVSLFLIISGAALMYVYGEREKFDWKRFYKQRFMTLFPMFWIAYFLVFLYHIYKYGGIMQGIPKRNIIFSILGMDGLLLNAGIKVFYLVGEWFLGAIIILYILFPLLLFLIKKCPVVLGIMVMVIYCVTVVLGDKSVSVFVRLPEFVFGMFFIKYIKKVKWPAALVGLMVFIANWIIAPNISENIQTTYVGIASFLVLTYISKFFTHKFFVGLSAIVSKYSFACFLTHHYITSQMVTKFDLTTISRTNSYLLFFACCVVIIAATYWLQKIHDSVMGFLKTTFQKEQLTLL